MLTVGQLAVLRLAANGLTQQEIATELFIARMTVHDRLVACRRKLGARNTTQAVAEALRKGMLT